MQVLIVYSYGWHWVIVFTQISFYKNKLMINKNIKYTMIKNHINSIRLFWRVGFEPHLSGFPHETVEPSMVPVFRPFDTNLK